MMEKEQSTLAKNGYVVEKSETDVPFVATKGDEKFLIKRISLNEITKNAELSTKIEILKTGHPHIVSGKNSFIDDNTHYVITDYYEGGNLAAKIKKMSQPPQEYEVLSYFVEICMALRTIHEKDLLQKDLTPEDIHLTECGISYLSEYQKNYENSNTQTATKTSSTEKCTSYLAPEVYTEGTYDAKSDIWSAGCILYELCTKQPAFSAESMIKLMPKILYGPYPTLSEFSQELSELLDDIFNKDLRSRPAASEILGRPFIIEHLSEKTKRTVKEIQDKLTTLRTVADGLERVHQGATIGSLTGGVIGALGGITTIAGLILAPFTLGASLVVTGVGVGVSAVGGVTAGASNIINMVNQSSDRKTIHSIIKEIEQKINAVVTWLQEINNSLQTIKSRCGTSEDNSLNTEDSVRPLNNEDLLRLGLRAGKGLSGAVELVRLVQVTNIGKIAAQTSRVVRAAEVATGVLSGLFVAVDIFFIAMDAKEIHHIRQAKAADESARSESVSETEADESARSESVSETETSDDVPTSDNAKLLMN